MTVNTEVPPPIDPMRRQALRLENLGAHDRAEALLVQVLAMTEAAFGAHPSDVAIALND